MTREATYTHTPEPNEQRCTCCGLWKGLGAFDSLGHKQGRSPICRKCLGEDAHEITRAIRLEARAARLREEAARLMADAMRHRLAASQKADHLKRLAAAA